eukprot:TRINITY_DN10733_c0_g2_i3.p1 TRINITY_DN10733_c0_g2~~TRINITY_DN10733_c0_g2_i3.p1  ORF type:complete len:548 (+),score=148.06 TRINITY_DN10733_c0_g2_i3:155-1798(+)
MFAGTISPMPNPLSPGSRDSKNFFEKEDEPHNSAFHGAKHKLEKMLKLLVPSKIENANMAELRLMASRYQQEATLLQQQFDKLHQDHLALQQQNHSLHEQLEVVEEKYKALKVRSLSDDQIAAIGSKVKQLQENLEQEQVTTQNLANFLVELEQQLHAKEEMCARHVQALVAMSKQQLPPDQTTQSLYQELSNSVQKLTDAQGVIQKLSQTVQQLVEQHNHQGERLFSQDKAIIESEHLIESLKGQIEQQQALLATKDKQLASLQKQSNELWQDQVVTASSDILKRLVTAEERVSLLESELNQKTALLEYQEHLLAERKDNATKLRQVSQAEREAVYLLEKTQSQVNQLTGQVKTLTGRVGLLEKELMDYDAALGQREQMLKRYKQERDLLHAKLSQPESNSVAQLQQLVADLEGRLKEKESQAEEKSKKNKQVLNRNIEFEFELRQGMDILKHVTRGKPHMRRIRLREGKLWWKDNDPDSFIALDDIVGIVPGIKAGVLRKLSDDNLQHVCFSIVAGHRTLDLQAESVKERDRWVQGLAHILKSRE